MAAGDVYQLNINTTVGGVPCANVYNFEQTQDEAVGEIPETELLQAWDDSTLNLKFRTFLSTSVTIDCATCRRIRPTGGPQYVRTLGDAGLIASPPLPAATVAVGTLYGVGGTRRGRGRKFISGLSEVSVDSGRVDSFSQNSMQTFLDRLLAIVKKTGSTAEFVFRIISGLDAVLRQLGATEARVRTVRLNGRQNALC